MPAQNLILLLTATWIKIKHAICCGSLWKCGDAAPTICFLPCTSQGLWRSGTSHSYWVKTGYTLDMLPVYGRATNGGLSFSGTPNSQLRVLSQSNVIVFLFFFAQVGGSGCMEHWDKPANFTQKSLTVVIRPWPYYIRRSNIKYTRQIKFHQPVHKFELP